MISTALSEQLLQCIDIIAFGLIVMFFFDVLSEISRQAKWHKRKVLCTEFLLIFIYGSCFYLRLITSYQGLLRSYSILALLLGIAVYYSILHSFCAPICHMIAKGMLWLFRWMRRILLYPWRMCHRFIMLPIKKKLMQIRERRKAATMADTLKQDLPEEMLEEII